jgi:2-dehydropantoate 2-reductase
MRVLIYGAGAIGGYLGSRILQSGHQVTMLDRQEMADAINATGITVREGERVDHLEPAAVSSLNQALDIQDDYDLIVMSLKSYDLPDALERLSSVCPKSATILTTGNGIGIERSFIDYFGAERVVAGSLTTPVSKNNGHHLVVERSRGLGLAPTSRGQDIRKWVALFQEAGVTAVGLDDYESMKWSKALLNMVGNATSAILAMPPGEIYRNPNGFDLEVGMLREILTVMDRLKLTVIDLPGPSAKSLAKAIKWAPRFLLKPGLIKIVSGGRGQKMPSFYIDLVSGRGKSEVVYHNGAVAQAGQSVGVETPVNKVLNDVLLKLTNQEIGRDKFEKNPERLYAQVKRLDKRVGVSR